MEDQDKAGSKPSDTTDTEEHTEATTYKSFVERDPVLVAEGLGASTTACGSSSSFGYGANLKGTICSSDRTDVFRISGGHCGETTSDVAEDNRGTSMECMPMANKTESYQDQCVEINTYGSFGIEGGMLVNEGLHLRTESVPVMVPSTELQFHSEKLFPAQTCPVTGYRLSLKAESRTRNELLASTNVESDKSGIEVGQFKLRSCDSSQITRESPAQDKDVEKTIVDASCEEAERASNNHGDITCARNDNIPGTSNNIGTSYAEVSKSCASNMIFSETANGVVEIGSYGPQIFWENPSEDGEPGLAVGDVSYKQAEAASGKVKDIVASAINMFVYKTNNLGGVTAEVSNSPVSQINIVETTNLNESSSPETQYKKTDTPVDDLSEKKETESCKDLAFFFAEKTSVNSTTLSSDNSRNCNSSTSTSCETKVSDTVSVNENKLLNSGLNYQAEISAMPAEGGLTANGIMDNYGDPTGDCASFGNIVPSNTVPNGNIALSDATPFSNIVLCDANVFTETQSSGNTVLDTISFDPNTSETSKDVLPSVEPAKGGHIANGIMGKCGDPTADCAPFGNFVPSNTVPNRNIALSDATPFSNIVLSDANVFTETHSSGNTVLDTISFDPTTSETSKDELPSVEPAEGGHIANGIMDNYGDPTGDCAPVGNIVPSNSVPNRNIALSDATPSNIVLSDANVFTESQNSRNTVLETISFDPNTSETSKDELPSVEPAIATAVKDGGLEFQTNQDAIQTCSENVVEKELVKQAVIQTCAKHGREEELASQDQPVPTCAKYDVEEDAEKQDTIKTCVEHDSEVEPAKKDESKKQDNKPTNQDEMPTSLKYGGGEELVGQKVKKKFGRKNYMGEVAGFDKETSWYKVTYEDGDEEDLEWDELKPILLQLKGGDSEIRKRKKHSKLGLQRRTFKRVRRPNDRLSRAIECLSEEKGTPLESNDGKEDEKSGLHTEDISVMDSGDRLSSRTRTAKRKHSEQSNESTKKRKVEAVAEARAEHDRASGSRIGNKLIKESSPPKESNLNENILSTRRNSGFSASNLETISVVNADIANSVPNCYDKAKLESHESADQKGPPRGGGISLIGRKTKKDFGGHVYIGEVIDYDYKAQYYKVKYEDGDEEELEWSELGPTLVPSEQKPLSFKSLLRARKMASGSTVKELSTSMNENTGQVKEVLFVDEGKPSLRKEHKPSSVLEEVKAGTPEIQNSTRQLLTPVELIRPIPSPPRPLSIARFASADDADMHEYFSWGEVIGFDKAKCPELGAAKLLPTSSPIVHLAASQHHLAAITVAGQVWLWRNRHGNIHTRCNEWEHIASLEDKRIVLVDIAGPDLDRASGGYEANQEDQVPDPFYLVAVGADGHDFILQSSQPQEIVRTSQISDEPQHLSLKGSLSQLGYSSEGNMGRIVQVSVGTVEAPDESPFIGYITDTDHVYIRSATKNYMEEVNLVSGYTGKPIKIQCGRVYHAIIMTDDGRAWTWGRGYYPGLNTFGSSGFSAATCQPAVGTLVGRKVIDVGCYGEDFIALTNDGDVHQWTHAVPNPAAGVYNVPATPLYGHGPCIPHGDKLKQVSIGAGICAGITDIGKVHTWRTAMKGGLTGIVVPEKEALTPLGHEENRKDTAIVSLGNRIATKVICAAGSLIVVVKKKARGRMGRKRKQQTTNTESGLEGQS